MLRDPLCFHNCNVLVDGIWKKLRILWEKCFIVPFIVPYSNIMTILYVYFWKPFESIQILQHIFSLERSNPFLEGTFPALSGYSRSGSPRVYQACWKTHVSFSSIEYHCEWKAEGCLGLLSFWVCMPRTRMSMGVALMSAPLHKQCFLYLCIYLITYFERQRARIK
jgi:hypothetical protein